MVRFLVVLLVMALALLPSCDSIDSDMIPATPSTYDVGSAASPWAEGHFDALWIAGAPVGAPVVLGQGAGAWRSSNQAVPTSVTTSIVFDTEQFDNDTMWEGVTSPSRLTIKTAGIYVVTGQLQWAASVSGARYEFIMLNGNVAAQNFVGAGGFGGGSWRRTLSTIMDLSVNDYVELAVYQNSGGNLNVTASSPYSPALQAVRIGP